VSLAHFLAAETSVAAAILVAVATSVAAAILVAAATSVAVATRNLFRECKSTEHIGPFLMQKIVLGIIQNNRFASSWQEACARPR
jgi:hypothetical protein